MPLESVAVPSMVFPSAKVTDPTAEFGVIDAVKTTFCPKFEGFSEDDKAVLVEVIAFTVCVMADDVLALNVPSPAYAAVRECEPTLSALVLRVATPPLSMLVPRLVEPSRNVTLPVACDGETVAVNVMICPGAEGFGVEVSVVVVAGEMTFSTAPPKENELRVSVRVVELPGLLA
jgi:hypothetical protein